MHQTSHSLRALTASLVAVFGLAACGGSGDKADMPAGDGPAGISPSPPTVAVPVRVIDGPLRNATVCVDANSNGRCEAGELQGRTDADGRVTLQVPTAELNRFPIVAVVGTDAVDADSGPVTSPYTLSAPADRPSVVTPLTTLVQQVVASTGATTDAAAATIQSGLGLTGSPLVDFTTVSGAEGTQSAVAARLLVRAQQDAATALASAVGQPVPGSSTAVSAADVRDAVATTLATLLPQVAAAVQDTVSSCTGGIASSACLGAVNTAAAAVVREAELTPASVVAVVASQVTPPTASGPDPSGTLPFFSTSGDRDSWSYRIFRAGAADLVPDANGRTGFRELRQATNASGGVDTWGPGSSFSRRNDTFWNGSTWRTCPANFVNRQTPRDAQGRTRYTYCDGLEEGNSQRSIVDISGRSLLSVVEQIRALPYRSGSPWGQSYGSWGPDAADGPLTDFFPPAQAFPAGSQLQFQTNTIVSTAIAYDPTAPVTVYSAAVAQGGDARTGQPVACAATAPAPGVTPAATLETVVERGLGRPCQFGEGGLPGGVAGGPRSGPRNEWWSTTTLSVGNVGTAALVPAASATTYYNSNRSLRVSFVPGGNTVRYWSCAVRINDGSLRNCDLLSTGTYTIAALGDARVMTLAGQPTLTAPGTPAGLGYERVFVERAGAVYFGFKNKLHSNSPSARLNLVAANALFARLNAVYGAGNPAWRPLPENLSADLPALASGN